MPSPVENVGRRPCYRAWRRLRQSRPVHALIVLGGLACAAILAAAALIVWNHYEIEVAATEREIVALSHALAEQTAHALGSADLILLGARERLARDRPSGYLTDERALHTLLHARIAGVPQVRALSLIDAGGLIKATSRAYPITPTFVGDRDHFLFLRNTPDDVPHVGTTLRSRIDGSGLLPLSRLLRSGAGGFEGVITAAIDPNYFAELYRTLDLGPGRTISLFLRDGTLVARTLGGVAEPGDVYLNAALLSALGEAAESDATPRLVRTSDQFMAYAAVHGYPLVVAVTAATDTALGGWRTTTAQMMWGAAAMIVVLVAITLLLARQSVRGDELGAALQRSEARLHGIIDSARDAILTVDKEQRIVVFNRAAQKMFRCTAQDALGAPLACFLAERPQATERRLAAALAADAGAADRTLEVVGSRSGGEEFIAEVSISRFEGEGDGLLTAFVRDITGRKQAEEALRKFSRVIDQTASTVVITDPRGVIEYVNPRFVETTGYTVGEALGKRPSLLKSGETPPDKYEELWRTITNGSVWHGEFHNRRKDGTRYWESAIISPVRDEYGMITHFVAVKDDITERKRAEVALCESHHQLREMAATLHSLREEEMIRISRELHDELGQKLTGLMMDLSWLDGRLQDQLPLREKVAGMKKLVDSTVRWVRRISTSLRPLVLDDLGPVAAVEWLADDFAEHSGIEVDLVLEVEHLDVNDRTGTALFRIVQESLTNVARHARATRVEISLALKDGGVLLSIVDNGRGMPTDVTAQAGGFGMVGIRERAFMCGGDFQVSSRPGEGTKITVSIPRQSREPAELPQ
ncbi:PAS domain S-box protein [Aromatoleum evansii]|uniref:PAS domain S-box protein n=1 Tax=Aromatoleum evansii TaxID=59406 RepID=UPI00145EE91E|nr:PAS domain S-box protein [Aromatoleum evansii]NMG31610.1 PAS domain S-box protein [Aromatoleum evansii]